MRTVSAESRIENTQMRGQWVIRSIVCQTPGWIAWSPSCSRTCGSSIALFDSRTALSSDKQRVNECLVSKQHLLGKINAHLHGHAIGNRQSVDCRFIYCYWMFLTIYVCRIYFNHYVSLYIIINYFDCIVWLSFFLGVPQQNEKTTVLVDDVGEHEC